MYSMISMKRVFSLLVVSQKEGIIVGSLDDFLFHRESREIKGWLLKKGGIFSSMGGIDSSAIVLCGKDVVLIDSVESIDWEAKRVHHKQSSWSSLYKGQKLIHRDGKPFASVENLYVCPDAKVVLGLGIDEERIIKLNEYISLGPDGGILPRKYELIESSLDGDDGFWAKIKGFFSAEEDEKEEESRD